MWQKEIPRSRRAPAYPQRLVPTGPHISSEGLQVCIHIARDRGLVRGLLVRVQDPQALQALRVMGAEVVQGFGGLLCGPIDIPALDPDPIPRGPHAALFAGGKTNLRLSYSGSSSTRQPSASTALGMVQGSPPASCQMSCNKASRIRPSSRSRSRTKASALRNSSDFAAAALRSAMAASPARRCSWLRLIAPRPAAVGFETRA